MVKIQIKYLRRLLPLDMIGWTIKETVIILMLYTVTYLHRSGDNVQIKLNVKDYILTV